MYCTFIRYLISQPHNTGQKLRLYYSCCPSALPFVTQVPVQPSTAALPLLQLVLLLCQRRARTHHQSKNQIRARTNHQSKEQNQISLIQSLIEPLLATQMKRSGLSTFSAVRFFSAISFFPNSPMRGREAASEVEEEIVGGVASPKAPARLLQRPATALLPGSTVLIHLPGGRDSLLI